MTKTILTFALSQGRLADGFKGSVPTFWLEFPFAIKDDKRPAPLGLNDFTITVKNFVPVSSSIAVAVTHTHGIGPKCLKGKYVFDLFEYIKHSFQSSIHSLNFIFLQSIQTDITMKAVKRLYSYCIP